MRSFLKNKRLVLLLADLSLGALTMLAISLNNGDAARLSDRS